MTQKVHSAGTKEARYFYTVNVKGIGKYQYRSRHADAKLVRAQFKRNGLTILGISTVNV